jgi:hypothetical protein
MLSRRQVLKASPLLAGGAIFNSANAQTPRSAADPAFKVKNGRIRQSVMGWCFNGHFTPIELAVATGCSKPPLSPAYATMSPIMKRPRHPAWRYGNPSCRMP